MAWKSSFRQNYRTTFSPTVPTSAAGISHVVADVEAPGGEEWEHLKSGGKQWQATPKSLPRMQRTRAISVAWLNSGLCPDRPKGWIPIPIIIIIIIIIIIVVTSNFISCLPFFIFQVTQSSFTFSSSKPKSLVQNERRAIFLSSRKRWISKRGGICLYFC